MRIINFSSFLYSMDHQFHKGAEAAFNLSRNTSTRVVKNECELQLLHATGPTLLPISLTLLLASIKRQPQF
jgi:hypothetical protein